VFLEDFRIADVAANRSARADDIENSISLMAHQRRRALHDARRAPSNAAGTNTFIAGSVSVI
jgi:hypothetical protein